MQMQLAAEAKNLKKSLVQIGELKEQKRKVELWYVIGSTQVYGSSKEHYSDQEYKRMLRYKTKPQTQLLHSREGLKSIRLLSCKM